MKYIDTRNANARKNAGEQPYYKLFLDSAPACPKCDAILKHDTKGEFLLNICDCGTWRYDWRTSVRVYEPKPEAGDAR